MRRAQFDTDIFSNEPRSDHPSHRLKAKVFALPGEPRRVASKTAGTVSAHLGFTAVAVVVTHPKITAVPWRFHNEQAVAANSAMPVAQPRNNGAIQLKP